MKKFRILALILCLLLSASLASCDVLMELIDIESIIDGALGHTCTYDEWYVTVEPTCSEYGEEEAMCNECFEYATRPIEKLAHTPEEVEAEEPTCTEDGHTAGVICSECGEAISGAEIIAATGHTEQIIPKVEPTSTTPGKTEGKVCSVCNEILVEQKIIYPEGFEGFTNHNMYDGEYAYNSLAGLKNGAAMQEFYMEIDAVADAFHISTDDAQTKKIDGKDTYYAAEVIFNDNGLTIEQALTTWNAYTIDHPLYYWMSKQITYDTAGTYITVIVDDDYGTAEARQSYNAEIYATVKEYVESLEGESGAYEIAYEIHNLIIDNAEYAYVPGTETPSDEDWAHNIIGVMINGEGVCESYAKTFQLLLNYCDVDCIFVPGIANDGAHAWNMVKLDNGEWYWYDLTWNDGTESDKYFCVTEMDDHDAYAAGGVGVNYTYELPEPAEAPYAK